MWDILFEGVMSLLGGLLIGVAVYATVEALVNAISKYLRKISREYAIAYKGKRLNQLIDNAEGEIRDQLRAIRDEGKTLLMPLDPSGEEIEWDKLKVTGSNSDQPEAMLVADDASWKELN